MSIRVRIRSAVAAFVPIAVMPVAMDASASAFPSAVVSVP